MTHRNDKLLGIVLRNRDLFHLWAVENIFQPKLLKDVLMKLNEQSSNVLDHIHNAAANECLTRGKALDKVKSFSDKNLRKMTGHIDSKSTIRSSKAYSNERCQR